MDITVKANGDGRTWQLIDLLGRSMGTIRRNGPEFVIVPEGRALETMKFLDRGPFLTLDNALAQIEMHTRGTCKLD